MKTGSVQLVARIHTNRMALQDEHKLGIDTLLGSIIARW